MAGDDGRIGRIIDAGTRAPSVHNTQPWAVRVHDERHLSLRADPARRLPRTDPQGREMFVSCGAFLLNLRVAAAHEGLDAHARLVPDPDDPMLVARVALGPLTAPGFFDPHLYAAIGARRTARGSRVSTPLDPATVALLGRAVALEQAGLVLVGPRAPAHGALVTAMRRAEAFVVLDGERQEEDRDWLGVPRGGPDGVPADAMGTWFREPVRDVPPAGRDEASGARTFESGATAVIVTTRADGPRDWVVAGQALERMLLVATTRGVQASFATRVLEDPATRAELERACCPESRAQMLLRLGYGTGAPATPRRDLDDVVLGPAPGPALERDRH
ncbi:Acg family FMN-binding oxidoreductase [Isoptericola sp. NPDC057559]|uniref:Acg family FMN-binding oxidoreductase n=1 Tax=Isoptericola sp. NPDC057559 TaxID=3346168 RepID=UPI0036D029FC